MLFFHTFTIPSTKVYNKIFISILLISSCLFIAGCGSKSQKDEIVQSRTREVVLDPGEGATGGTTIIATRGEYLPEATAPIKDGFEFKGYFTEPDGKGTRYYSEQMYSTWPWESDSEILYAYWVVEPLYDPSMSYGTEVYVDIVSITPKYSLNTVYNSGYPHEDYLCLCETSTNSKVWIKISSYKYTENFNSDKLMVPDSNLLGSKYAYSTFSVGSAELDNPKRIHGKVSHYMETPYSKIDNFPEEIDKYIDVTYIR